MKIAIIGYGFVGKEIEKLIRNHYDYCIYDPFYEVQSVNPNVTINDGALSSTYTGNDKIEINKEEQSPLATKEYINENCELAIVCVSTPEAKDGSCDTSIVEESIHWLETNLILVKSTVEPGTVFNLKCKEDKSIVFSPEYTGESKYYNPIMKSMQEEPFVIFGGAPDDTQALVDIYKPIMGPLCKYIQCTAIEAEMAKYLENTFFAAKVSFFNEFYEICEACDVEYDRVRELFLLDPRIHPMHTAVFKDNRGFGGKCLPKDIKGLVAFSEKVGFEPKIMKQIIKSNEEHKERSVREQVVAGDSAT